MSDKQQKNTPETLSAQELDQVAGGATSYSSFTKKSGALKKPISKKFGSSVGGKTKGIMVDGGDGSI